MVRGCWTNPVASWSVISLLVLWALFYVIAPNLEEPWLEQQYGEAFTSYKPAFHDLSG